MNVQESEKLFRKERDRKLLNHTNMEILIERKWKKAAYTIGALSVDGIRFCESLEDTDRGLKSTMPVSEIQKIKVYGQTAIPTGRYQIVETYSPKFKKNMPLLVGVKGFTSIRIHPGNTNRDTEGCILCGRNTEVGKVTNSRYWFNLINDKVHAAIFNGYKVWITIK